MIGRVVQKLGPNLDRQACGLPQESTASSPLLVALDAVSVAQK